ncbi:hypothetical protein AAC387_Pa02g3615 [Persea americana]
MAKFKNGKPAMKKNVVFSAAMDEELLSLMHEQVMLGGRGDRGFKNEAYTAVAKAMSESSQGRYVITAESVRNRCKLLKKNYAVVTELLNAPGFGFDSTAKRVVASDDTWNSWLERHPDANTWRSKTIDYEKLSLVYGIDAATIQFPRPLSIAGCAANVLEEGSDTRNYNDMEEVNIHLDDTRQDFSGEDDRAESSSKSRGSRKRPTAAEELVASIRESTEALRTALLEAMETISNPSKKIADEVIKELIKIPELNPIEVELAHEWLVLHKEMSSIFLSTPNKREWILRRLPKIRVDSLSG